MSVTDKLDEKQLLQLLKDLQGTRDTLERRGWVPGYLIHYRGPNPEETGGCCMTGAAGCATEGGTFIQWVIRNLEKIGKNFPWSRRGRVLLALLAQVATELGPVTVTEGDVSSAIDAIISVNDRSINDLSEALAWVDRAVEIAKNALPPETVVGLEKPSIKRGVPRWLTELSESSPEKKEVLDEA